MGPDTPRVGVISFPGSNGDHDALNALVADLAVSTRLIDYRETDLSAFDAIVLPGGFSYGDALRCGAIARFSPIMEPLRAFAEEGKPVLGICNGFQILCEAHLLPGALLRNATLRFHCHWTYIRIESTDTSWTRQLTAGDVLRLPVAHGDGAYFANDELVAQLEENGQIVARYCTADGAVSADANTNGSVAGIAAVANERGNVIGLMPHPERATNALIGGADGLRLLQGLLAPAPIGA
ncbi:MAG TPA: phosphoribosylformylglycinamidine synthase subunit PurQ [Thermomicrobiales bacterium]|nr:phosphoribosylformylglycinamidine synthase subunit PurQ [Thermomicrobiales bacterium]